MEKSTENNAFPDEQSLTGDVGTTTAAITLKGTADTIDNPPIGSAVEKVTTSEAVTVEGELSEKIPSISSPSIPQSATPFDSSTFKGALVEDFEGVRKRLEKSAKLCEYFLSMTRLRINLELHAADQIEKFFSKSDNSSILAADESSVASTLEAYKVELARRADQSRRLAYDLESDVIAPTLLVIQQQEELYKKIDREGLALVRALQGEYRAHDDAVVSFDKAARHADGLLKELAGNTAAKPQVRLKLAIRAAVASREASSAEDVYRGAVIAANTFRRGFLTSMDPILDTMQEMEIQRLQCLRDSLQKSSVFGVSWARNIQYDISQTMAEVDKADASLDITSFISRLVEARKLKGRPVGRRALEALVDVLHWREMQASMPGGVASPDPIPETSQVERKVIQKIWTAPGEITRDDIDSLEEPLKTPIGRLSLLRSISLQDPKMPTAVSLGSLARLLIVALDAADAEQDSDTGRRVAGFAQKFYFSDDSKGGKKRFLQTEIYHHGVWNRVQFWEDSLALVISDDFIDAQRERSGFALSDTGMTVENFGSFMLMFGIAPNPTRELCKRVISKNHEMLGALRNLFLERLMKGILIAEQRQQKAAQPETLTAPATGTGAGKNETTDSTVVGDTATALPLTREDVFG